MNTDNQSPEPEERLTEDLRRFEGKGAMPKRTTVQQMKHRLATGGGQ